MRQYTKEEKAQWMEEFKNTGLTAKEFAKDKPFCQSSLSYWKKQKHQSESVNKNGFIELISTRTDTEGAVSITYPNGVILEMDQLPSVATIKQLIGC